MATAVAEREGPAASGAYQLQAKQWLFVLGFGRVFEVLYGGAAGAGKSDALLVFQLLRREKYAQSNGLFLRRHFTELHMPDGAIPRSHELFRGRAAWKGDDLTWTFPNGSVLKFGHLNQDRDKHQYQSAGFEDVCFDELTHFEQSMYLYLFSRIRSTHPTCQGKVRAATNPGNVGHAWVKERFLDGQVPFGIGHYARIRDRDTAVPATTPRAKSRAFVPGRLEDNAYLYGSGDYESTLEALPEDDYRALRWGDWDAWSGSVFKRFQRHRHVLAPRQIDRSALRLAGLDWGFESPTVVLWIAYASRLPSDPLSTETAEGLRVLAPRCNGLHGYVYRELTLYRHLDDQAARATQRAMEAGEQAAVQCWNADPASFFAHQDRTGPRPDQAWLTAAGIRLLPSDNSRIPGKRTVDDALADCACGVPRLRFFSTCTETIRTLPLLGYDQVHPEDVMKSPLDHWYDALRYALRGVQPVEGYREGGLTAGRLEVVGRYA